LFGEKLDGVDLDISDRHGSIAPECAHPQQRP
jgi:hypothetical protein